MGRIFETRKHTMFARWDRMAKQFARIGKDITIAVKAGGPDAAGNPLLRRVVQNARAVNMPKEKVESAIRRAAGKDAQDYQEILYEGYAPHGVAVIVVTATNNPTRTVGSVRSLLNRGGGNLGTTGSVAFQFKHMGVFRLNPSGLDSETLELDLIDHGLVALDDGETDKGEKQLLVRCAFNDFGTMQAALESRKIAAVSTESEYVAATLTELPDDKADEVMKLVASLESDDDVQNVYSNLG